MTTFNSISEIVNEIANFNSVANFNKEPFILVPSYTGEYIPNWDIITEDDLIDGDPIAKSNPFFALPEDDILGIQDYLAQEGIVMLIYIPLTLEALDPKINALRDKLKEIVNTAISLGDDDYFDYIPDTFWSLYYMLIGKANLSEDPNKAFQALIQDPKMTELLNDFEDRYYYGDPNDTDNIYNNIQPGAYEDYDLSYLHK